ncbi:hypothetical protein ON010_g3420 [Phytophthora cinnamomi]|nr:hypothetical protein ON010_g3420 [Phytophthora cinnamomi]
MRGPCGRAPRRSNRGRTPSRTRRPSAITAAKGSQELHDPAPAEVPGRAVLRSAAVASLDMVRPYRAGVGRPRAGAFALHAEGLQCSPVAAARAPATQGQGHRVPGKGSGGSFIYPATRNGSLDESFTPWAKGAVWAHFKEILPRRNLKADLTAACKYCHKVICGKPKPAKQRWQGLPSQPSRTTVNVGDRAPITGVAIVSSTPAAQTSGIRVEEFESPQTLKKRLGLLKLKAKVAQYQARAMEAQYRNQTAKLRSAEQQNRLSCSVKSYDSTF